jgi:hypothetical protein
VRGVTRSQELHARTVEADAIEMDVVRILTLFPAGSRDVGNAQLVVDALERRRDELTVGNPVLESAGSGIVEIVVTPAVALRPEGELRPVVGETQRL